jgi:hypothetical protein
MITYAWKVTNYFPYKNPVEGLHKVIHSVGWIVTGERDGVTVERMGVTELPPVDPESFVPYEDVTDPMALEWVRAQLDAETGLSDINGDVPSKLTYWLRSIEVELDSQQPAVEVLPPKSAPEGD